MKKIFLTIFVFLTQSTMVDSQPLQVNNNFSSKISKEYIQKLSPQTNILGKFRSYGSGKLFLIPDENPKVKIPISNFGEIPTSALEIPAKVRIEKNDAGIQKKSVTLRISSKWDTYKKRPSSRGISKST